MSHEMAQDGALGGALSGARILMVHETLELAGAERQSFNLACFLRDRCGATVEFMGFSTPGALATLCDSSGFRWSIQPISWGGGRGRRLRAVLDFAMAARRVRPTVLMPYTSLPNVLCGLTWRWVGADYCVWGHRAAHPYSPGRRVEKLALRLTPCTVSNSQHAAQELERRHRLAAGQVHVVRNGVRLDAPRSDRREWRERLGAGSDDFVVTMLAAFRPDKDHATVLRAWRAFLERDRSSRRRLLVLAGRQAEQLTAVKALAFDLGLGGTVCFPNHVEDVSGLLAASDAGVFASFYEGVPNGVLECMASGLIVVASDHPGLREALGAESDECVAAAGDAAGLARLLDRAMLDRDFRERWGNRNRRRVEVEFSIQGMCRDTAALIIAGLDGSATRRFGEDHSR